MTDLPVWTDPREEIEYSVLMGDGRRAPRAFANRAEAEAWARPDLGDEVIAKNMICSCDG